MPSIREPKYSIINVQYNTFDSVHYGECNTGKLLQKILLAEYEVYNNERQKCSKM